MTYILRLQAPFLGPFWFVRLSIFNIFLLFISKFNTFSCLNVIDFRPLIRHLIDLSCRLLRVWRQQCRLPGISPQPLATLSWSSSRSPRCWTGPASASCLPFSWSWIWCSSPSSHTGNFGPGEIKGWFTFFNPELVLRNNISSKKHQLFLLT